MDPAVEPRDARIDVGGPLQLHLGGRPVFKIDFPGFRRVGSDPSGKKLVSRDPGQDFRRRPAECAMARDTTIRHITRQQSHLGHDYSVYVDCLDNMILASQSFSMKTPKIAAALFATFVAPHAVGALLITEINYNPPEAGIDFDEFIEITNTGLSAVDLSGYSFSSGVTFTFGSGSVIAPSEIILIAKSIANLTAGTAAGKSSPVPESQLIYSIPPGTQIFEFDGNLSNGGETITLDDGFSQLVTSLTFDDGSPWPAGFNLGLPDGGGGTIEMINTSEPNPYDPSNWRQSTQLGGSPGSPNSVPEPSHLVLLTGAAIILAGRRKRG